MLTKLGKGEDFNKMTREGLKRFISELESNPKIFQKMEVISRVNIYLGLLASFEDIEKEKREDLLRWVIEGDSQKEFREYIIKYLARDHSDLMIILGLYPGIKHLK